MEAARYALMHDLLLETAHWPWPVPDTPWVMEQTWRDLLFAHWSYPVDEVRAVVPAAMRLDTFTGKAWVGVVPFMLENLHARGLPCFSVCKRSPAWTSALMSLSMANRAFTSSFGCGQQARRNRRTHAVQSALLRSRHDRGPDRQMALATLRVGRTSAANPRHSMGITHPSARRSTRRAEPSSIFLPSVIAFIPKGISVAFSDSRFIIDRGCCKPRRRTDAAPRSSAAGLPAPRGDALLHFSSVQHMIGWAPYAVGELPAHGLPAAMRLSYARDAILIPARDRCRVCV